MKKKAFFICFILIAVCLISAACSGVSYNQNLLTNGDFSDGLSGWQKKSDNFEHTEFDIGSYTEGVDSYGNPNKFYFASINNIENAKAALTQRVRVERGETYRLTVKIGVTSNFSGSGSGASMGLSEFPDKDICVDGSFNSLSPRQYGNSTGYDRLEYFIYFTVNNVDHVTIELRANLTGAVRFLRVTFEKIKLDPTSMSYSKIVAAAEKNTVTRGSDINPWAFVFTVLFGLAFIAAAFFGYEYIAKQLKTKKKIAAEDARSAQTAQKPQIEKPAAPTAADAGPALKAESADGDLASDAQTESAETGDQAEAQPAAAETAPAAQTNAPKSAPAPQSATTPKQKKKLALSKEFSFLLIALGIVFVLKLVFAGLFYGNDVEFKEFGDYAAYIVKYGLSSFYGGNQNSGLAPGYVYILGFLGLITQNMAHGSFFQMLLFRLPAIIADAASSILIFFILKRGLKNKKIALAGALLYALNIAVLLNSAWWGQFDSIAAALLLLAFYTALTQKYAAAYFSYAAAVLFKVQSIFALPIFLAYLVIAFIKKRDKRYSIGIWAGVALLTWFAVSIPLTINQMQGGNVFYIFTSYAETLGINKLTLNAFNFYGIFGFQNASVSNPVAASWIVGVMIALLIALLVVMFVRYKGKGNIILALSAYLVMAIRIVSVNMHEFYSFACLPLLFVASLLIRDRRLYFIAAASALLEYLCGAGLMLTHVGAYANTSVLMIVGSVLSVAVFVYFTFVLFDILSQDKIKPIKNYTNVFK